MSISSLSILDSFMSVNRNYFFTWYLANICYNKGENKRNNGQLALNDGITEWIR